LSKYEILVKLLVDGVASEPFLGKTVPPVHVPYGRKANLIRRSREKYANGRSEVEDKIERWMGNV
jgi:hypothetical protein